MSVAQRAGRIYVDYNQNLAARNTIAPYSMRGRARAGGGHPGDLGRARRRTRPRRSALQSRAGAGAGGRARRPGRRSAAGMIRPIYLGRQHGRLATVSLNIKNEETHRLVRRLAELTGQSQTSAVEDAVRRRLEQLEWEGGRQARQRRDAGGSSAGPAAALDPERSATTRMTSSTTTWACPGDRRHVGDGGDPGAPTTTRRCTRPPSSSLDRSSISAATTSRPGSLLDRRPVDHRGLESRPVPPRGKIEIASCHRRAGPNRTGGVPGLRARFGTSGRLNFGDCFAYALAIERDEPLLFKGDDFSHTDVRSALG